MISQGHQEAMDRLHAKRDYQVKIKAELEILQLHQKFDHLLLKQRERLVELQDIQLELIYEINNGKEQREIEMPVISWQEMMLVGPGIVLLAGYHLYLYFRVKLFPLSTAIGITNHARRSWTEEIRKNKRDLVAVQTLRNQVMAATFLASTAILISLGLFGSAFRPGTFLEVSHALNVLGTRSEEVWMFKLMLLGILFFCAFFNFTLSIRYYNHSGFMINTYTPDDSTCSDETVSHILNRGALHYTIGMRGFYLSIPLFLWMFGPIWMLAGSVVLIILLYYLDREP